MKNPYILPKDEKIAFKSGYVWRWRSAGVSHGTLSPVDNGNGNGGGQPKPAPALVSVNFGTTKNAALARDVELQIFETRKAVWGYLSNEITTAQLAALKPTFTVTNGGCVIW